MANPVNRYDDALAAVAEAVNACDPMSLLELGAPPDEYDAEVKDLVRLILSSEAFALNDVAAIWVEWFGDSAPSTTVLIPLTRKLQELQRRFTVKS